MLTVWLAKVRLEGFSVIDGAGEVTPVPDKATSCGLFEAESTKCKFAVREPVVVGVNCTETVHDVLIARLDPQPFTKLKSPGFAPVRDTTIPVSVAVPVLVRTTLIEPVLEPTT